MQNITETGDLSEKDAEDEVAMKKYFSKQVVAEKGLDSRKIGEIIQVKTTIDG